VTTFAHKRIKAASHRVPDEVDSPALFPKANFDHDLGNIYEKP
jgi:hypothetical protein